MVSNLHQFLVNITAEREKEDEKVIAEVKFKFQTWDLGLQRLADLIDCINYINSSSHKMDVSACFVVMVNC